MGVHVYACVALYLIYLFIYFRLEELLENQKKEEAIHTLISIDRVRGLIETIALRKKFLKHLASIKQGNLFKYIFFCTLLHQKKSMIILISLSHTHIQK